MSLKEYIDEFYPDENIVLFDGLESAFMGIGYIFNKPHACYDKKLVLDILMFDGMSWEEAQEYYEVNIAGLYAGESTPMLLDYWGD